jgi:hypothetical protein
MFSFLVLTIVAADAESCEGVSENIMLLDLVKARAASMAQKNPLKHEWFSG